MFDLLNSFVGEAKTLTQNVILVMAIIFVGWTWWKTKALTATLGALLFAAVVVWGVNSIPTLRNLVNEDVQDRTEENDSRRPDPRAAR